MPTVLRVGPYRFFFFAADRDEPHHVHVEREDKIAKFWLDPVRLQTSGGFSRRGFPAQKLAGFGISPENTASICLGPVSSESTGISGDDGVAGEDGEVLLTSW